MTVILIDANHCAGAVMFLFQGYFGCILYTADFRYFDGMLDVPPFTNDIVINTLYLDNTYCDPKCEFPSKAEAKELILQILHDNPDKDVVFGMDRLGKEEMLYEVAKRQNTPIVVDEFRYKTAELLGFASFFTTDPEESYIRVENKRMVNRHKIASWNMQVPTIGILPTCLYLGTKNCDNFANSDTMFVVPYSDHSSFTELKTFVAKVKPQRIIPVVTKFRGLAEDAHDRKDFSVFAAEMSLDTEAHVIDIPSTVVGFMSQNQNGNTEIGGKKRKASTSYFNGHKSKRACGIVFASPEKQAAECEDKNPASYEQDTNTSEGIKAVKQQNEKGTNAGNLSSIEVQVDIHTEPVSKIDERIRIQDENDNNVTQRQKIADKSVSMVGITLPGKNQTHSQPTEAEDCERLSLTHKCGRQDETQLKDSQSDEDVGQITADERIAKSCPTFSTESQKTRNSMHSTCFGDETSRDRKDAEEVSHDSKDSRSSEIKGLPVPIKTASVNNTVLSNSAERSKVKVNLSKSCFRALPMEKKPLDLDLTNLNWLQVGDVVGSVHITSLPDNGTDNEQDDEHRDLSNLVQAIQNTLTLPKLTKNSLPNGNACEVLPRPKAMNRCFGFQSKLGADNEQDIAQNTDSEPRKKDAGYSEQCAFARIEEHCENNDEDCENPSRRVMPQMVRICTDDQEISHGSSDHVPTVCLEPRDSLESPNSAPLAESTSIRSGTHCPEKNPALVELSQSSSEDFQLNTQEILVVPPEYLGSKGFSMCSSAQSEICSSNTEMSGDIRQEDETEQGSLLKDNILSETSENQVKQSSEIQCELIDDPLIPLTENADDPQATQNKNSDTHQEEAPKFDAESDKQINLNEDANTQELFQTIEFQKGAFETQEHNLMPLHHTEAPVIEETDSTCNTFDVNASRVCQSGHAKEATCAVMVPCTLTKFRINQSEHQEEEDPYSRHRPRSLMGKIMKNNKLSSPQKLASDCSASDYSQITHVSDSQTSYASRSQELSESEKSDEYTVLPGLASPPMSEKEKSPRINKMFNAENQVSKSQIDEFDREKEENTNPAKRRATHRDKKTDTPEITHNKAVHCKKCKRVRRRKIVNCTEARMEENTDDPQTCFRILSSTRKPSGSQSRVHNKAIHCKKCNRVRRGKLVNCTEARMEDNPQASHITVSMTQKPSGSQSRVHNKVIYCEKCKRPKREKLVNCPETHTEENADDPQTSHTITLLHRNSRVSKH